MLTLLLVTTVSALASADLVRHEITVGIDKREYFTHAPKGKAKATLFLLHGGSGTAEQMATKLADIIPAAEREGILVVAPQGANKGWSDGRPEIDTGHDDMAFLRAVKKELVEKQSADPAKFFIAGISNGGFMATRVLCEDSAMFRGYAVVVAHLSDVTAKRCEPKGPVAVLRIYGDEDPLVPFAGGDVRIPFIGRRGRGHILGAKATDALLASALRCGKSEAEPELTGEPDDGTKVAVTNYVCGEKSVLKTVWIKGGGHTWPGGPQYLPKLIVGRVSRKISATTAILDFFRAAALP